MEDTQLMKGTFQFIIFIIIVTFIYIINKTSKKKNKISLVKKINKDGAREYRKEVNKEKNKMNLFNLISKPEKIKHAYHGLRCYARDLTSGERIVVNYLEEKLNTRKYYIFNNLTLKTEDGSTQIDHVIVSPYGIFVIETKDKSGWIFGNKEGKVWTQTFPNGEKYTFQNPFRQNYKHIKTLQKYLPFIQTSSFVTVIAFGRYAEFKTKKPYQVQYFDHLAGYILGFDIQTVSKAQFFMAIGKLSQLCQSTDISREEHINNLNKLHSKPS